jgi:RimJ/RimL family protein N-acetyltransferase
MLSTSRLVLRAWRPQDFEPFAAMNADSRVMRYFPSPLSEAQTSALLERISAHFERYGFGLWAAELKGSGEFAGFIGLSVPQFEAHFTPCVEIGWRLGFQHWNQGLATEGAFAVLRFGMEHLGLREIVSFTAAENVASRRVMEKIGMFRNAADDFEHPLLPEGHVLRHHVLYRARRE